MRKIGWRVILFLGLVAVAAGHPGPAWAASAVAASIDNFGFCYGLPNPEAAGACALRNCRKEARAPCSVIVSCARPGHGAIFMRQQADGVLESVGAACGRASRAEAFRQAARACDAKAHSGPCNGPHGVWRDE